MSPSEHHEIVAAHERLALNGNPLHLKLSSRISEVLARGKKQATSSRTGARARKLGTCDTFPCQGLQLLRMWRRSYLAGFNSVMFLCIRVPSSLLLLAALQT